MKSGGVVDTKSKTWYPDEIARDGAEKLSELEAALPATPPEAFAKYRSLLRPNLVRLTNCRGLVLEGVTFQNSGSWNVHLELCDEVQIRQITIFDPAYAQNGDGIDMESCRDVVMEDSKVDAGDDGICLKSGKDEAGRKRGRPTENVTITRCTVGTGHGGVVIGSEMSGGVRNVNVSDCVFRGTDNGLRFKSERGRGGTVENINVKHVEMSDIQGVAILFDMYYEKSKKHSSGPPPQVDEGTPAFRDFNISQIKCSGAYQGFELRGLPERPLENLKFDDIHINADAAGAIQYVNGITLHDVHVDAAGGGVQVKDVAKWQADGSTGFDFSPVKSADQ
jgi:polygalacturonase